MATNFDTRDFGSWEERSSSKLIDFQMLQMVILWSRPIDHDLCMNLYKRIQDDLDVIDNSAFNKGHHRIQHQVLHDYWTSNNYFMLAIIRTSFQGTSTSKSNVVNSQYYIHFLLTLRGVKIINIREWTKRGERIHKRMYKVQVELYWYKNNLKKRCRMLNHKMTDPTRVVDSLHTKTSPSQ